MGIRKRMCFREDGAQGEKVPVLVIWIAVQRIERMGNGSPTSNCPPPASALYYRKQSTHTSNPCVLPRSDSVLFCQNLGKPWISASLWFFFVRRTKKNLQKKESTMLPQATNAFAYVLIRYPHASEVDDDHPDAY